jgi:MFS family permease
VPAADDHTESSRPPGSGTGIRPLLAATGISVSGDGALRVAGPLLATLLTSDPAAVAAVTAATFLPWLLVGLPAGALADRWPPRRVMVYANLFQAGILVLFCMMMLTGIATLPALLIAILLVNVAQCFFSPAAQVAIPAILGQDKSALLRGNGRLTAVDTIGRAFIGPLGGAWVFTINRVVPFLADALSFFLSAILLARLPSIAGSPGPHESVLAAVRTGFRHLFHIRELLVLALSSAAYNIGYFAAVAPLVLYTRDVLHVGPVAFGALFAVLAAAAVTASWTATGLIRDIPVLRVQTALLAVAGLAWSAAAVFPNYWVTAAMFGFIGVTASFLSTSANASCQRLAPEGSLARVSSIFRLFAIGAMGIGALIGGWLAAGYGLFAPLIFSAAIHLAAAVVVWAVQRGRRRVDTPAG